MKGLPFVLLFTAMTFVAWGTYGPVLHHGAVGLNNDSMRAFVGVGLAYFLIAVIFPILILRSAGENGKWTISGAIYSLIAGAVGAVGALGIILALGYGGQTLYVMPLVFGFAPVVNTLVTALLSRTFNQIRPIFVGGIITAALGAGGVLYFKPAPLKPAAAHPSEEFSSTEHGSSTEVKSDKSETDVSSGSDASPAANESANGVATAARNSLKSSEQTASAGEPVAAEAAVTAAPAVTEAAVTEAAPATIPPKTEPEEIAASFPESGEPPAPKLTEVEPKSRQATEAPPPNDLPPEVVQPPQLDTTSANVSAAHIPVGKLTAFIRAETEPTGSEPLQASGEPAPPAKKVDVWMVALSIVIAALCWGSYGPMLHIGQAKMNGSRLRPFTCVGLAYFFIAVAAPLYVIYQRSADTGSWTAGGMTWSFLAGVAGAIGALGVILAFNAGGKPYYVMPLVFGFAPVINTFISLSESGSWARTSPMFWVSLAVVIAGAITVLTNAPKPKPKPKPATST